MRYTKNYFQRRAREQRRAELFKKTMFWVGLLATIYLFYLMVQGTARIFWLIIDIV